MPVKAETRVSERRTALKGRQKIERIVGEE